MQLRTAYVVTIVAAAAGVAAGRATAPQAPPLPAPPGAASHSVASGWLEAGGAEKAGFRESTTSSAAGRAAREPGFAAPTGAGSGSQSAVVYVAGAVAKPGVYTLRATARANEALHAAGGASAQADLVAINLAAHVRDGEEIAVPLRGPDARPPGGVRHAVAKPSRRHSPKRGHRRKRTLPSDDATDGAGAPTETVDLNTADEATLETLPGVGPSLARRIVAFRDLNGPFASPDELLDVGGMTAGKVDGLSPYVTFR